MWEKRSPGKRASRKRSTRMPPSSALTATVCTLEAACKAGDGAGLSTTTGGGVCGRSLKGRSLEGRSLKDGPRPSRFLAVGRRVFGPRETAGRLPCPRSRGPAVCRPPPGCLGPRPCRPLRRPIASSIACCAGHPLAEKRAGVLACRSPGSGPGLCCNPNGTRRRAALPWRSCRQSSARQGQRRSSSGRALAQSSTRRSPRTCRRIATSLIAPSPKQRALMCQASRRR